MPTQRFDGPTLEAALEQARKSARGGTRVVAAHKVRTGGVGGWFSKEHVEVEVEIDEAPPRPARERPARAGTKKAATTAAQPDEKEAAPRPKRSTTAGTRSAARSAPVDTTSSDRTARVDERAASDTTSIARPEDLAGHGPVSVLDLVESVNTAEMANLRTSTPSMAGSAKSTGLFSSDKPWAKAAAGQPDQDRSVGTQRSGRHFAKDRTNPGDLDPTVAVTSAPATESPAASRAANSPVADSGPEDPAPRIGPEPSTERSAFSAVLRRIASEAGLPVADDLDDDEVILDLDADLDELPRLRSRLEQAAVDVEGPAIDLDHPEAGRSEIEPMSTVERVTQAIAATEDLLAFTELSPGQELMLSGKSGPALSPLGDDLFEQAVIGGRAAALARLGVPEDLLPALVPSDLGPTWRDLRQILAGALSAIPEPMPLPDGPGSVIAIIGTPRHAAAVARSVSKDLGLDPDEVVIATWRRLRRPNNPPLTSAQAVRDKRQSWQWRTEPTVVAVESEIRPDTVRWTRKMLVALDPTAAWGAVDACLKLDDIASWSQALGGLDALALVDLDGTASAPGRTPAPRPAYCPDRRPGGDAAGVGRPAHRTSDRLIVGRRPTTSRRRLMFEACNPALVLMGTLLLWLPTLRNLLRGNLNVTGGLVRFGLALAVSWLANELVRRVLRAYAGHNAKKRGPETPSAGHRRGDGPGAVLQELKERPLPESRLTRLRQDPHPSARGAVSRLKRPSPPARPDARTSVDT